MFHIPGMGFGPGFSLCWRTFRSLDPRRFDKGSADLFLDNYSVFGSGGHWDSRKSCKYEGGELNCSRIIVVFTTFGMRGLRMTHPFLDKNSGFI